MPGKLADLLPSLAQHGYLIVFGAVFLEFACAIPLFSTLVLLAAGVMVQFQLLHPVGVMFSTLIAMLMGDTLWYHIGQRRGQTFLKVYCRLTMGSGQCVDRTERFFQRHGSKALLVAKFIAGFSTFAAPMAGWRRMPLLKFLLYDAVGAVLWSAVILTLGYLFADQIESVVQFVMQFNRGIVTALLIIFGGYVGMKLVKRKRFGGGQRYFVIKQ